MTARDRSVVLRAEVARITAVAQSRLADLVAAPGATRARRAELRAARRKVWADRQDQIDQVTVAFREQARAARRAASADRSARHRAAGRAQQARRRLDRQTRQHEQALYRAAEEQQ